MGRSNSVIGDCFGVGFGTSQEEHKTYQTYLKKKFYFHQVYKKKGL